MKRDVAQFQIDPEVEGLVSVAPWSPEDWGSPPDFAWRAVALNTGTRLPKRTEFVKQPWHQTYYPDEDYDNYPGGMCGGWCPPRQPVTPDSAIGKALTRRQRRLAREDERRKARDMVPPGNLENSDYQFWRGSAYSNYKSAICRWCDRMFYNVEDRRKHFHKEGECSKKIRAVQLWAGSLTDRVCFVCQKPTHKLQWGFPLCNEVGCIGTWKFGTEINLKGWLMYKTAAVSEGILQEFK